MWTPIHPYQDRKQKGGQLLMQLIDKQFQVVGVTKNWPSPIKQLEMICTCQHKRHHGTNKGSRLRYPS